jgi:2-dehydro-3-deoxygalactonokinase
MDTSAQWIAGDWGSTRLRLWSMRGTEVLARAETEQGMATVAPEDYEPALLHLVEGWLGRDPTPALICGMAGARQGWAETPYAPVPTTPLATPMPVRTRNSHLNVYLIGGLSQTEPPDVMRGEETQIAGFLALNPGWDGVICLPGTHTKWAHVSAGEVVSFQTFLTGEIFALLGNQSVLRHSVAAAGMDAAAFAEALSDSLSRPERLAARLFSIRARDLLQGADPVAARARLSGLLIGAELAAARPYWLGQQVAVIGPDEMARLYALALDEQGVPTTRTDATAMVLAGLGLARKMLKAAP